MLDLEIIAGDFYDVYSIPKEKEYMLRYFKRELPTVFLIYYIKFKSIIDEDVKLFYDCFFDHTGVVCARQGLRRLVKRYEWLEEFVHNKNVEGDFVTLARVRSGQFKLKELGDRDRCR